MRGISRICRLTKPGAWLAAPPPRWPDPAVPLTIAVWWAATSTPACNTATIRAGPYPINFFVPNPYVGDLTVTDDNSYATYNALQATVRHRLKGGLTATSNYTFSKALSDLYGGSNTLTNYYTTIRNFGLSKSPIPQDVRQAFQSYFTYDLPVGKGGRSTSPTAC